MDFTREPIIETVITPKEGCTLAIRSSKGVGQEEFFVDAVEMVSFGDALFFRSQERPKSFLLPVTDYEILEVREARLVLKNVGLDRSIKIGGGREAPMRTAKPQQAEKGDTAAPEPATIRSDTTASTDAQAEVKLDKKRDRRRNSRRKRGRDEVQLKDGEQSEEGEGTTTEPTSPIEGAEIDTSAITAPLPAVFSSLLPPPATLISETIARYKDNALFRGAFFLKEDSQEDAVVENIVTDEPTATIEGEAEFEIEPATDYQHQKPERPRRQRSRRQDRPEPDKPLIELPAEDDEISVPTISLDYPQYVSPPPTIEMSEEEEERIYQQRQALRLKKRSSSDQDEEPAAEPSESNNNVQHEDDDKTPF